MAISASLSPIPNRFFTPAMARHLLERAGTGGSPADIAELHGLGLQEAVQRLAHYESVDVSNLTDFDADPDIMRPATAEERAEFLKARRNRDQDTLDTFRQQRLSARGEDRRMHSRLQRWWAQRMIDTPRPAEEKRVLLWHCHFATRHRDVRDAYLMYRQQQTFRAFGNASFADLAKAMVRDPAMIIFLNNDRNIRRRPNENLAREFMELFTLGEGQYTEDDIKEAARALTGYHRADNDFKFRRLVHDGGDKTILGQTDDFDGDSFVKLLLKQKATSRYIALKLYRHYVADVPEYLDLLPRDHAKAVNALGEELLRNRYHIGQTLETLFKSRMFYDREVIGNKIKSPAHLVAGAARSLKTPNRSVSILVTAMSRMGQALFEPPSVAGWDGGRAWINTSTMFMRQNLAIYLITGHDPTRRSAKARNDYDPTPLLTGLTDRQRSDPTAVVDHLADALLGPTVGRDRRAPMIELIQQRTETGQPADRETLVKALTLMTAMPEYQLC
ncbi:MAG: DUF1800 domain-containing protein [Planctomycetota bacterium]